MKIVVRLLLCMFLVQSANAATVDTLDILSAKMKSSYKCVVITPDTYKKSNTRRYPVVYLLHGYSANYASWLIKIPALKQMVDTYQCIVVCPDGAFSSWYFDSPIDSAWRFETYIGTEIPEYIDHHYQTISDRKGRAIAGFSMGGHGALWLAIRHSETFGAVGSMSGGVDFRPFPKNWDIAKRLGDPGPNGSNWTNYTVINEVNKLKPGGLSIIVDCGVKDFFIDVNRQLHQRLLDLGIDHDYTERPGQHNWDYWANAIKYQMLFFNQFFNK